MILLDTNVISEMMKLLPSGQVIDWMDSQVSSQLFISTVTIAEIAYGLNALPNGHRKQKLEEAFGKAVSDAFKHRILSFDQSAAFQYGKIMAQRKIRGRPMSVLDGQIAAIACAHGFSIATRNTEDFMYCGISIVNPFN